MKSSRLDKHWNVLKILPVGLALLVSLFVLKLTTPPALFAQGATGAINGTVMDTTGAVIPEAKVVLRNVATGTEVTAMTNSVGRYVFVSVLPGNYTLTVSKQGFLTTTENEFELAVNQTSTHDFTLKVGAVTQEVTVSATTATVEASTSELGTAIEQSEVNNLPLNGRNFSELLQLTPGVSPISTSQNSGGGGGFVGNAIGTFTFPSVNGAGNRENLWLIDGMTNYGYVGNYSVEPILDSIEEFKVQGHNDIAAYGGSIGGIINVATKAGTAEYHGDVYDFLRNNALDSRNTFIANTTPYKQNQFGGVFGGPLLPGHFRNGAPKTFFFAGYEGFRSIKSAEALGLVPTPAQLSGDMSSIADQLYNPFSTRPDPSNPGQYIRDPFPNNQIPSNLLATPLMSYGEKFWPSPINTGVVGKNMVDTDPNRIRQDTVTLRFDHQFTDHTSGWIRYTGFNQPDTFANGVPGVNRGYFIHGYETGGAVTHTFGDGSKVLSASFSRNSSQANVVTTFPKLGGDVWPVGDFSPLFAKFKDGENCNPGINFAAHEEAAEITSVPDCSNQKTRLAAIWEPAADFTVVRGHHTFQVGGDANWDNTSGPINFVYEDFSASATTNPESPAHTGDSLASFLLGVPVDYNKRDLMISGGEGGVFGWYVQDQWKATPKLQVNFGLRWDLTLKPIYGQAKDHNTFVGNVDTDRGIYELSAIPPACGSAPCIPGGVLPAHVVLTPLKNRQIYRNTYDNWQPRLGLAYSLRPTTVLRASAGKFFENWAAWQQFFVNNEATWPDVGFLQELNLNVPTSANPTPTRNWKDPGNFAAGGGAAIVPAPTPFNQVTWFADPYMQNPYSEDWNLGIQQQLRQDTVLEADYVGSHGSRTDSAALRNVATTPGPGDPSLRYPFPYITPTYFDKSVGKASYEAFQFKINRRTSHGLTYLVAYTWSKTMDLGCDGFFGGASEGCSVQNPYNLQMDKSVAGYDLTHMLTASWVYSLPFGKGMKYTTANPVLNNIVGNWALNGIFTARSGVPFTMYASGDIANTGDTQERAELVGPPFAPNPNRSEYLNPSSWEDPTPFTYGNSGRNMFRGPHVTNWDLSLFRMFPIKESTKLEFRAEFFNAFNLSPLNLGQSINVSNPYFYAATSTATTERQIQFALKLYF